MSMEKQQHTHCRSFSRGKSYLSIIFISLLLATITTTTTGKGDDSASSNASSTSETAAVNADGSFQQVCSEHDQDCLANNNDKDNYDEEEGEEDIVIPMLYDDDDNDDDLLEDYNEVYGDDNEEDNEEDLEEDFEEDDEDDLCKNDDERCDTWTKLGECKTNPTYMLNSCRKSCGVCVGATSYGLKQNTPDLDDPQRDEVVALLEKMEKYMQEEIIGNPELSYLVPRCKNRHADCSFWAKHGECDVNPNYMLTNCAPVCNTCHLLDLKRRCPIPDDAVDSLKPGDLNKMFEKSLEFDGTTLRDSFNDTVGVDAATDPNADEDSDVNVDTNNDTDTDSKDELKLVVKVLSRPSPAPGDEEKKDLDYKLGPWVITIDNFIQDEECKRLIKMGAIEGYQRSEDVGKELFDGTYDSVQSSSRTSHNAWCQYDCYKDPHATNVAKRIELLTGVPEANSENLQLLKYEVGQFYKTHHDYIDNQEEFPSGPRTLTAFLYLSDVEAGGGTNFSTLGITVQPKKGRLLLWPSVLNDDPVKVDRRTYHQALPVEKGLKYAANGWLHLRDFKTPNDNGCT